MTLEEYFEAETPEIIAFVKKTIGLNEFTELCKSAIIDDTLVIPQCDNEVDIHSRRIEAAVSQKALEIIFNK